MSEVWVALAIWLPAGTLVPFVISMLTGSDWRGALIEASLFAALGLLIVPTTLALLTHWFVDQPRVNLLFLGGFFFATLAVLLFRRSAGGPRQRRPQYYKPRK